LARHFLSLRGVFVFLLPKGQQENKKAGRSQEGEEEKAGDMAIDLKMCLVFEVEKLRKSALTLHFLKLKDGKNRLFNFTF
jgi:hypothetical protein